MVDYHGVALRSRAVHEVALNATKLSSQYGAALLDGLLGWRGIGGADASARRDAGASFGTLTMELSRQDPSRCIEQFAASIDRVLARLRTLQNRQVDERHGLLLCLAAVLDWFPELVAGRQPVDSVTNLTQRIIRDLETIFKDFQTTTYRKPELVAEAASRLITSSLPILQAASTPNSACTYLQPGFKVVSTENIGDLLGAMKAVDALDKIPDNLATLVSTFNYVADAGLARPEKEAIAASSEASLVLLIFSRAEERRRIIEGWASAVRQRPTSRTANDTGVLFALTMAYPVTTTFGAPQAEGQDLVCDTILTRWASDNDIETRVAILQSLSQSGMLHDRALVFLDLLAEGLNDYTTNARGDVGSHVRLEALRATKSLWKTALAEASSGGGGGGAASDGVDAWLPLAVSRLFLRTLRLAAEKLDRVRTEAHAVLALNLESSFASGFAKLTYSSKEYFRTLLDLYSLDAGLHPRISQPAKADVGAWMAELLAGYVTSADTGNEDLVIASRAALADFCAASPQNLAAVCAALVSNVKTRQGQDRVVVPTLEIVAFLCHVGLFQKCPYVDVRHLCLQVQKAAYKTGSVRKLEACIKVYGCLAGFEEESEEAGPDPVPVALGDGKRAGILEARKRLAALMFHPWPRVRSLVVDELWKLFSESGRADSLKSVDWSKADKASLTRVVEQLGLRQAV
ncbi:beta-tubulin cofactor d [Colletotrichum graminicola M1.001]|uniref:Beta-tubulin cofactor d n=1 Tax=Colletotrichum graminicola (strain M1.001 / M2 / FGSC 10212) TaxID=645133 RepID=E3QA98_COLGM|nr:beta-tubulin cofactor d [Colletotrichum graminicola M1.001]EFQ27786.1 beta-tubulin cofactor d [Colletotrichum graminicola M1.001]